MRKLSEGKFVCAACGFLACALVTIAATGVFAQEHPGCEGKTAKECLALAMEAMGGRERLAALKSVKTQGMGYTQLEEQSYRQEPFISSYTQSDTTMDFAGQRMAISSRLMWPESDAKRWTSESKLAFGPEGGVRRGTKGDSPVSVSNVQAARQALALGPLRVLLTADAASDLHFEAAETLRTTPHTVLAFTWEKIPVRVLVNEFNHLPDAVETTQEFLDFWYYWGDVKQRIYFDNWKIFDGIEYPTNQVEERNGVVWRSSQAYEVTMDEPIDDKDSAMDAKAAQQSMASQTWATWQFAGKDPQTLAPGVDLFLDAWNSTIVKQADGIVILEAPISGTYMRGVVEEAKKRYPGVPVKAVLSTSDSWPHTGGVRYAVSQDLPVYVLDLNRPLLDREGRLHIGAIRTNWRERAPRRSHVGRLLAGKPWWEAGRIAWSCIRCAELRRSDSTWCIFQRRRFCTRAIRSRLTAISPCTIRS